MTIMMVMSTETLMTSHDVACLVGVAAEVASSDIAVDVMPMMHDDAAGDSVVASLSWTAWFGKTRPTCFRRS